MWFLLHFPNVCLLIRKDKFIINKISVLRGRCVTYKNYVTLVRERTIPTERPPPVGEVSANFCGQRGVTWSAQRFPTAVLISAFQTGAATFYSSSSSIDLTRLSGPRSRPTTTQKIWQRREQNPRPLYMQPETPTTRPQRRSVLCILIKITTLTFHVKKALNETDLRHYAPFSINFLPTANGVPYLPETRENANIPKAPSYLSHSNHSACIYTYSAVTFRVSFTTFLHFITLHVSVILHKAISFLSRRSHQDDIWRGQSTTSAAVRWSPRTQTCFVLTLYI